MSDKIGRTNGMILEIMINEINAIIQYTNDNIQIYHDANVDSNELLSLEN